MIKKEKEKKNQVQALKPKTESNYFLENVPMKP